ncbi:hypothetical protein LIS90_12215 [Flavobacterium psychrophilum]|uniref:thiamine pyrophosphate-binding protein n=1 Tax=Flavobacterium psychrophilum TaxID=96345 RepID=UPI001D06D2D7|nr:thiamine pyrophosphate-binding protein [Flavobacterium psychrophilum]MCB6232012.1 hypothetical protein [Flavobacterium psychrophilum]
MKPEKFIHDCMVEENIKYAICLPDSLTMPLTSEIKKNKLISYIQATHESDCVGISTGLNITNTPSIVIMENSGIRNACETIARFHLSHALYNIYIISFRGDFGERNWWGQAHSTTMKPLLDLLRFRYIFINDLMDFKEIFKDALNDFQARQSSIALIISPKVLKFINNDK